MTDVISNSSPLILLAKIGKLNYLFSLFNHVIIPPEVYNEVITKGLKNGYPDAIQLEELYKKNLIIIKNPKKLHEELLKINSIHLGEIEAISLALEFKNSTILLDDEEARIFARSMGIKVKGTLGLLVDNYKNKIITQDEAKNSLNLLNDIMYLSGNIYQFILQNLKE